MTEDNERCIKIKQDYLNTEKISAKIQTRVFFLTHLAEISSRFKHKLTHIFRTIFQTLIK